MREIKRTGPGCGLSGEYLKAALTGLVAGYCLALVLGRSVWLDMRVTTGHVIPIFAACFVLFIRVRKRPIRLTPFLLLELLAAVLLFSTYGFSSATLLIVPAGLFREGFHLSSLSLLKIDLFLLCFLGVANAVWIYHAVTRGRRRNGNKRARGESARSENKGAATNVVAG
jgi:hypothetical protein